MPHDYSVNDHEAHSSIEEHWSYKPVIRVQVPVCLAVLYKMILIILYFTLIYMIYFMIYFG